MPHPMSSGSSFTSLALLMLSSRATFGLESTKVNPWSAFGRQLVDPKVNPNCEVELGSPAAAAAWQPPAAMTSCSAIRLSGSPIGEAGGAKLATVLSRADQLESLDLSHMELCDGGVKAVMGALNGAHQLHLERRTPSKLMQLHLEHNMIASDGAVAIAVLLSQPGLRLEQLVLHSNNIGPQGAYSLALPLVKNSTLRSLDLHNNRLNLGGTCAAAAQRQSSSHLSAPRCASPARMHASQARDGIRAQDQRTLEAAKHGAQRAEGPLDATPLVCPQDQQGAAGALSPRQQGDRRRYTVVRDGAQAQRGPEMARLGTEPDH